MGRTHLLFLLFFLSFINCDFHNLDFTLIPFYKLKDERQTENLKITQLCKRNIVVQLQKTPV